MIVKQRDGYFLIFSKKAGLAMFYNGADKCKDEVDVIVNKSLKTAYSIVSPGEYEIKGVFTIVIDKKGDLQYLVNIEDINILLINPAVTLSEADLDEIGTVDILILKDGFEWNMDLVKFVNRIDPKYLLLQNSAIDKERVQKLFGSEINVEEKKLQVKESDLAIDEYKLEIFTINDK